MTTSVRHQFLVISIPLNLHSFIHPIFTIDHDHATYYTIGIRNANEQAAAVQTSSMHHYYAFSYVPAPSYGRLME